MERTTVRTKSARRDDIYEETVTDTEKRRRQATSVSISEEMLYVERYRRSGPPGSSEIVPNAGRMLPVPRLSGDSTAEPDA